MARLMVRWSRLGWKRRIDTPSCSWQAEFMVPLSSHPASWTDEKLLAECSVTRQRRSGPGGQHRNKVETAVVIHHLPSGVRGQASERRSQAENRQVALVRLRLNLALEVRTASAGDGPREPSDLWRSRTRGARLAVSTNHADFPALLAEALDLVAACAANATEAARRGGVSTTQLVRFLGQHPPALAWLNALRAERGLKPLR